MNFPKINKEKPTVEFIALTSGVEQTMPIIKASEYRHSWMMKAAQDFKNKGSLTSPRNSEDFFNPEAQNFKVDERRHTLKCPAIGLWQNTGWIMRLHQDVKIEILGGTEYKWITPAETQQERLISWHMEQSLHPFFENWPKDTMKKIIKFNLPWVARIPKGYKLLQMHPFYLDDFRFTAVNGILESEMGHAAVGTIPAFFHATEGTYTIKAGTPLAQFILIPKDEADFKNIDWADDPNYKKERNINFLLLKQSFDVNYNKIRDFWKKYGW
tara:strand:+ start:396 stop:1205 length:810 start_codon:yes stop_codon:yes gene_type:complete